MRGTLGGLRDIEVPVTELNGLAIAPRCAIIVENLETGLALPDIPDTVAFMRLGNAVSLLSSLTWLRDCSMLYWGDIDTHGFVILNRPLPVHRLQWPDSAPAFPRRMRQSDDSRRDLECRRAGNHQLPHRGNHQNAGATPLAPPRRIIA